MAERHHGEMTLRTVAVSASRRVSRSGETSWGVEWRESRNGLPEREDYDSARRAGSDREAEVAALVAAARAEALRRARQELGPGPLQRRAAGGYWEPVDEEGKACVSTDASYPAAVHLEHLKQSGTKSPAAAEPRSWVIAMPAGMELLNANDRAGHWGRRRA